MCLRIKNVVHTRKCCLKIDIQIYYRMLVQFKSSSLKGRKFWLTQSQPISCQIESVVSFTFSNPVMQPFSVISIQAVIHVQDATTLLYFNVCLAHFITHLLNIVGDLLSSDYQSWADLAMKRMKSSRLRKTSQPCADLHSSQPL